jgi:O-antigen/teichoic acid export membrane protein
VGIYLVAIRVAEVVIQVANAASALLFPHVAAQSERGDTAATERVTRVTLVLVVGAALVVGALAEAFLAVAFGATFAQGTAALRVSLVAMVPLALARVLSGDLKGRGRAGLVSICNAIGVAVTVGAGLLLIPSSGIEGAAFTSVLAYSSAAVALTIAYRTVTGAPVRALAPRAADIVLVWSLGRGLLRRAPEGSQ